MRCLLATYVPPPPRYTAFAAGLALAQQEEGGAAIYLDFLLMKPLLMKHSAALPLSNESKNTKNSSYEKELLTQ